MIISIVKVERRLDKIGRKYFVQVLSDGRTYRISAGRAVEQCLRYGFSVLDLY